MVSVIDGCRKKDTGLHDSIDASAIFLPHRAKPWLTTQVPATATGTVRPKSVKVRTTGDNLPLQGDMTFLNTLQIESDSGNGASAARSCVSCGTRLYQKPAAEQESIQKRFILNSELAALQTLHQPLFRTAVDH